MENIDITRARVYVCTDKECSQGNYKGVWLDLIHSKTIEEFKKTCLQAHSDESQAQCIYFESESIPQVYITSQWIEPKLFELIRELTELEVSLHIAFSIWLNFLQPDLASHNIKNFVQSFIRFNYEGMFSSKMQFTYFYAENKLGITKKDNPDFKFSSLASFLFFEDYSFLGGYVFKNNR